MLRNTRLQNERGTISRSPLYWVTGWGNALQTVRQSVDGTLTTPYTLASHSGPICTRHEKCAGIGQRRRTTSTFAEVEAVDKVCETWYVLGNTCTVGDSPMPLLFLHTNRGRR
jgi:hypothetical protein